MVESYSRSGSVEEQAPQLEPFVDFNPDPDPHEEDGISGPRYLIRYGSKEMKLRYEVITNYILANTFIKNIENSQSLPNETTIIYRKAKEILQGMADASGYKVVYIFRTRWPKLARWALSTGDQIFEWTRKGIFIDPGDDLRVLEEAQLELDKDFLPSNEEKT